MPITVHSGPPQSTGPPQITTQEKVTDEDWGLGKRRQHEKEVGKMKRKSSKTKRKNNKEKVKKDW